MKSLELTDYVGAVSDVDDTILDNQPDTPNALHELSRLDALRTVGAELRLTGLSELPAELNAVAFHNASVHSVEGAFWWLLAQIGIVTKEAPIDPEHPLIQQLLAAKSTSYRQLLATEAREVPGARAFFAELFARGFAGRLAIASTGYREDILAFFGTHGFADYFPPQNIIARENTTRPKPDPESFRMAIESLGLSVDDAPKILAFEDDPRGITAAKALGMFTCAVTTRFSRAQLLSQPVVPDFVAADFKEYMDVFGLS